MFPAQSKNIVSMVCVPVFLTYTDFEWGIRFKLQRQNELLWERNFKILVFIKKKKRVRANEMPQVRTQNP